jgi:hypothetical protein
VGVCGQNFSVALSLLHILKICACSGRHLLRTQYGEPCLRTVQEVTERKPASASNTQDAAGEPERPSHTLHILQSRPSMPELGGQVLAFDLSYLLLPQRFMTLAHVQSTNLLRRQVAKIEQGQVPLAVYGQFPAVSHGTISHIC